MPSICAVIAKLTTKNCFQVVHTLLLERANPKKYELQPAARDRAHNFYMMSDGQAIEFAHCFLRLANLPNFALDRLSRYETKLWRQVDRILVALEALDRRKPQERRRYSFIRSPQQVTDFERE